MNDVMKGALAGFIATAPMTLAMGVMFKLLPPAQKYPLPPRQVTLRVLPRAAVVELDEPARDNVTLLSHFAYGAVSGAVYAPIASQLRPSPLVGGIVHGLVVWSGSYLGWLPAVGIMSPATQHPAERNALMIAAHVVWGAAAGALIERLLREDEVAESSQPEARFEEAELAPSQGMGP